MLALAAAISPSPEPVTTQDVLNELRAPAAAVRAEALGDLTPPPYSALDGRAAQDPAPAPTPPRDQRKEISLQLRMLSLLEEHIYAKLATGKPINDVLREADSIVKGIETGNKTALASLEKALASSETREQFRDAQNQSKDAIDAEMKVRLEERLRKFGTHQDARGRGGSGFLRDLEAERGAQLDKNPSLRGSVERAAKKILTALQIEQSGDTFIDKSPKPYERDPHLRSALSVNPWMDAPSVGLKPEEIKALYERSLPKTPQDAAGITATRDRQNALYETITKEQPEPVQAQLKNLEERIKQIAADRLWMESRGVVPGVNYDPAVIARLGYETIPGMRDADTILIKEVSALKEDERERLKELRPSNRRR